MFTSKPPLILQDPYSIRITQERIQDPDQIFLVFKKELITVTHLRFSEKVLWLVEHKYFPRAIYLCKRLNRTGELYEVSDRFAVYLWKKKRYRMVSLYYC